MKKWWLFCLIMISACIPAFHNPAPTFKLGQVLQLRTSFEPPPEYEKWWKEVEQCTKLQRPMDGVRFFELDIKSEEFYFEGFQFSTLAFFWYNDQSITVIRSQRLVKWKVKHEMIHALVNTKKQEHTEIFFKCD
jgi:hypothetical protein